MRHRMIKLAEIDVVNSWLIKEPDDFTDESCSQNSRCKKDGDQKK